MALGDTIPAPPNPFLCFHLDLSWGPREQEYAEAVQVPGDTLPPTHGLYFAQALGGRWLFWSLELVRKGFPGPCVIYGYLLVTQSSSACAM